MNNDVILSDLRICLKKLNRNQQLGQMSSFCQHGTTSCLLHCIAVAYFSCVLAKRLHLRVNQRKLLHGALLHDYYLYDWHKPHHGLHGFSHPSRALENAEQDFPLDDIERDVIKKHMFPLTPIPPKHVEGWLVCAADKYCAVLETMDTDSYDFLKEIEQELLAG